MLISVGKITYSTVGSSFTVSFSFSPDENEYLQQLYDTFKTMDKYYISKEKTIDENR